MANKIYLSEETRITFGSGVGVNDVLFTPSGLAAGSGYISVPRYLGASPRSKYYKWKAKVQSGMESAPNINGYVEIYWASAEDSIPLELDGGMPSGNQILGLPNQKKNLKFIGAVNVDVADTGRNFIKSGVTELVGDYGAVVWWNQTLASLGDFTQKFELTPIPDEIQ